MTKIEMYFFRKLVSVTFAASLLRLTAFFLAREFRHMLWGSIAVVPINALNEYVRLARKALPSIPQICIRTPATPRWATRIPVESFVKVAKAALMHLNAVQSELERDSLESLARTVASRLTSMELDREIQDFYPALATPFQTSAMLYFKRLALHFFQYCYQRKLVAQRLEKTMGQVFS